MESLGVLMVLAILAAAFWMLWQWRKSQVEDKPVGRKRTTGHGGGAVQKAAKEEGHDYVLEPFDGDRGQGYTIRRVDDWQQLRWESADTEDGLLPFGVAGESFNMDDLQDSNFSPGSPLSLVPEPENPHDPNAVAVKSEDQSLKAGYVPAELAEEVRQILDQDEETPAISLWEVRAEGERKSLRVLLVYGDASVGVV